MTRKCMKLWEYVEQFLRFISVGKVFTGFFYRDRQSYSTVGGGLLTILISSGIFCYAMIQFWMVINHLNKSVSQSQVFFEGATQTDFAQFNASWLHNQIQMMEIKFYTTGSLLKDLNIDLFCKNQSLNYRIGGKYIYLNHTHNTSSFYNQTRLTTCTYEFQHEKNMVALDQLDKLELFKDDDKQVLAPVFQITSYSYTDKSELNNTILAFSIQSDFTSVTKVGLDTITVEQKFNRNFIPLKLTFMKYSQSTDIIGVLPQFEHQIFINKFEMINVDFWTPQAATIFSTIEFYIDQMYVEAIETPYTFMDALPKIGGVFAVLSLLNSAAYIIHIITFQRSLKTSDQLKGKNNLKKLKVNKKTNADEKPLSLTVNDSFIENIDEDQQEQEVEDAKIKEYENQTDYFKDMNGERIEDIYSYKTFKHAILQIQHLTDIVKKQQEEINELKELNVKKLQ